MLGVIFRTLCFLAIVAVSVWVGYVVFNLNFWLDYTQAFIAAFACAIAVLSAIFATIDYCLMTSWGKPSVEYEAYSLTKKIKNCVDTELKNNA